MSYKRAIRFEGGETLIACSICGFPYLFPSELSYCDDRLFRCKRTCMEQTKRANDRQQVQSQKRRDNEAPLVGGAGPGWRTS